MLSVKQVFVSHDTEDAAFAHRLAADLERRGLRVWIAPESIRPGESWVSAIERGLAESSHMLIVLTPAALDSQWVKKETEVAIALERKGRMCVIPLHVKSCQVPLLWGSYQMVSFRGEYGAALSRLLGVLGISRPPTQPPSRQPRQVETGAMGRFAPDFTGGRERATAPAAMPLGGTSQLQPAIYSIVEDECIACGACEPECPTEAIYEGENAFVIDPARCTGCVGSFGEAQCAAVCPTEACVPDPQHPVTAEQLLSKFRKLHPGQRPRS